MRSAGPRGTKILAVSLVSLAVVYLLRLDKGIEHAKAPSSRSSWLPAPGISAGVKVLST